MVDLNNGNNLNNPYADLWTKKDGALTLHTQDQPELLYTAHSVTTLCSKHCIFRYHPLLHTPHNHCRVE